MAQPKDGRIVKHAKLKLLASWIVSLASELEWGSQLVNRLLLGFRA